MDLEFGHGMMKCDKVRRTVERRSRGKKFGLCGKCRKSSCTHTADAHAFRINEATFAELINCVYSFVDNMDKCTILIHQNLDLNQLWKIYQVWRIASNFR